MPSKVDLTLIKKLVDELDKTISLSEKIKESSDNNEYIIEMSKGIGLCSGIVSEGTMLIADIAELLSTASGPPSDSKTSSLINKLFGNPSGSSN